MFVEAIRTFPDGIGGEEVLTECGDHHRGQGQNQKCCGSSTYSSQNNRTEICYEMRTPDEASILEVPHEWHMVHH